MRAYPIPCQSTTCDSAGAGRIPRHTTRWDGLCVPCSQRPAETYAAEIRRERALVVRRTRKAAGCLT